MYAPPSRRGAAVVDARDSNAMRQAANRETVPWMPGCNMDEDYEGEEDDVGGDWDKYARVERDPYEAEDDLEDEEQEQLYE